MEQTCSTQVLVHEEVGSFSAGERFALAFHAERPPAHNYHDEDNDNSIDEKQQQYIEKDLVELPSK